jgi:spore coat protein U-like protein
MGVTATVPQACTVTTTPLAFSNHDAALGTGGSSNIAVTCKAPNAYTIDVDAGANPTVAGTAAIRSISSGAQQRSYLFSDRAHTKIRATGAGADLTGTADLTTVTPVHGFIPASQTAGAGVYTDTIHVTLTY